MNGSARIAITGCGLVTSLGRSVEENWRNVLKATPSVSAMSDLELPSPDGKGGYQAVDLPGDFFADQPREVRYLRWTLNEALRSAGIDKVPPYDPTRCGCIWGTTLHGMRAGGRFLRSNDFNHLKNFLAGQILQQATVGLPLRGDAITTCSACSSSLGSIALAVTMLQTRQLDLVIAGGYDAVSEYAYGGFNALRLVADGPLRSFAKDRRGMKLGEGYALLVLERAEDAEKRFRSNQTPVLRYSEEPDRPREQPGSSEYLRAGVEKKANEAFQPLAIIAGWGESADAHHLTQPDPGGRGAMAAIQAALARAKIQPADVGLIAAHATGTPDNDAGEHAAFAAVFGERLPMVPVTAFKTHLGHTLGGAGAVELILSMMALRSQIVPAVANVTAEDVQFAGLNLATGGPRRGDIAYTLNTSLGFGGANTCVVLKRVPEKKQASAVDQTFEGEQSTLDAGSEGTPEDPDFPAVAPGPSGVPSDPAWGSTARDVCVSGIGIVLPSAIGVDAFAAMLRSPGQLTRDTGNVDESQYIHLLSARRVRRMSTYVKLSLAATALACADAGFGDASSLPADTAVLLGSTHGSASFCVDYYRQIVQGGLAAANPALFAEGVPNAAAAHLSLMLGLKGACQTVIGSRTSGLDALRLAALRIASGEWDRAIVGAAEEYLPLINEAYRHCGLYGGEEGPGFVAGSGAVTFILESRSAMEKRGGRCRGVIGKSASVRIDGDGDSAVDAIAEVIKKCSRDTGLRPVRGALGVESSSHSDIASTGRRPVSRGSIWASANGTWVDRAEALALQRVGLEPGRKIADWIGETFSAGPLLAMAAGMVSGDADAVALCTGYDGVVSALRSSSDL